MKKIINGKCFNTETADVIGSFEYGVSGDFTHVVECLYRTKKGQFFMYYEGGPMSKYAVSHGNNSTSGSYGIDLIDDEAAKKWAEKHLTGDEYEEVFGECEEG